MITEYLDQYPRLLKYAKKMSPSFGEDVLQEVFLRLIQNKIDKKINFTYLKRTVKNSIIDRIRHNKLIKLKQKKYYFEGYKKTNQILDETEKGFGYICEKCGSMKENPELIVQKNDIWEKILDSCEPRYHNILKLKKNGFSTRDIAKRINRHTDHVHRILREIKNKYENQFNV